MNDIPHDEVQTSITATRRQIDSLGRKIAERHPGDKKMAWPITVMLKELGRLELLHNTADAEAVY